MPMPASRMTVLSSRHCGRCSKPYPSHKHPPGRHHRKTAVCLRARSAGAIIAVGCIDLYPSAATRIRHIRPSILAVGVCSSDERRGLEFDLKTIEALAPDQASLSSASKLTKQSNWPRLEKNEQLALIWGECQGSGSNPIASSSTPVTTATNAPVRRESSPASTHWR